jgi:GNAT superfamily N-acetyltransferase
MYWRLPRKQWTAQKGDGNRRGLQRLVTSGAPLGVLAYAEGRAVGWCAVGPRESFPGLDRSRVAARVDDAPVWSITCLFVDRAWRGRGVSVALLEAAARYAGRHGTGIAEGYPVEPRGGRAADAFVWTGLASAFRRTGFAEVARRSATRPVMRRALRGGDARRGRARREGPG